MTGSHRARLLDAARRLKARLVTPYHRQIMTAAALVLVVSAVLLTLTARLPFPSTGERILYDPTDWSLLFHAPSGGTLQAVRPPSDGPAVGGATAVEPALDVLLYKVKPGDTISAVSIRLGLNVDTVSSLNRVQGRGVHNVTVGEILKIPSQNGIYMPLAGDFDQMCQKYQVSPDDVLAANGIAREALTEGMQLFFPNVQHTGYAYALSTGVGVAMPVIGWETDAFGSRLDPFTGAPSHHYGVDIAAAEGTPIRSATDGVVTEAGWDSGYGNYVRVAAPLSYSYIYGHMSRIATRVGARISTGQVIGYVGHTGYATGPHLHFEVRWKGVPQNPRLFLKGIR
jgi:murein DD-endopeptidase MepM/ murein hydrolase activator NlpD